MIDGGARVYGYRFDGYWQDVGTIQSYWEANMALLEDAPELDLNDRDWPIHTRSEERPPAVIGATAQVHRIADLARLRGERDGRELRAVAGRAGRCWRRRARLDRDVRHGDPDGRGGGSVDPRQGGDVGPGAIVGDGTDLTVTPNAKEPGRLTTGITVVGKRAVIPRSVRIGRNVRVDGDVRATDFPGRVIRSGATVERRDREGNGPDSLEVARLGGP